MRFQFALATPTDDAQLRARMAADFMPGPISVSFRREPSYFRANALLGEHSEVIKCYESATQEIVGLGARHLLQAYVNGTPRRIGYLSDLRGAERARGGTLLARGYRYLHALHTRDPAAYYYSVIFDSNAPAKEVLTSARAGLPAYRDLGRILTPALQLGRAKPELHARGVSLRRARSEDVPTLLAFLAREHARKQFAAVWRTADLRDGFAGTLNAADFCLACRGERIVGALALWDQQALRQTVVAGYSGMMRFLRPMYNALARLGLWKPLPEVGAVVPHLYLAAIAIEEDARDVFAALLRFAYREACRGPWHYAIPSLHERDPLAEVLASYRAVQTAGRLFAVSFPGSAACEALDSRVPYVDMARA